MAPTVEDHRILDTIARRLHGTLWRDKIRREGECIEFEDKVLGQWYEIVVRPIDGPSREGTDGAAID